MARTAKGPGQFFAAHPIAYAMSLTGAGFAVAVLASRATRARGLKRQGWILLSALEAVIFVGIVTSKRTAAKRAPSD